MSKGKSIPMTFLIAGLLIGFVAYAISSWFRDVEETTVGIILLLVGLAVVYYSINISKFEEFITRGLLWGGVLLSGGSLLFFWDLFSQTIRPIIIGLLLVGVIYFGTKYKKKIMG